MEIHTELMQLRMHLNNLMGVIRVQEKDHCVKLQRHLVCRTFFFLNNLSSQWGGGLTRCQSCRIFFYRRIVMGGSILYF